MSEVGPLIAASILNADFGRLDRVIHKVERSTVDRIHLDVMDGHFVDNITFGADIVAAVRRLTGLPLDVHLMISEPSRYVDRFADAGPETITFHVEVPEPTDVVARTLERIHEAGLGAGLAVSPDTPIEAVADLAGALDLVTVMTVEPGWGGQGFIEAAAAKIGRAKAMLASLDRGALVHVDGGVNRDTAHVVGAQSIDVCVVGSALFQRGRDAADEVRLVRERAKAAAHEAVSAATTNG